MQKQRILIVITKGDIGGAQVSVFNLAKQFKKNGHDVTVGFGQGDFLKNKLKEANIPHVNFRNLVRSHNPVKNLLLIFEIKKYLDSHPANIVHFNSSNALLGAIGAKMSKCKPKTVFTFRGLSVIDPHYAKNSVLRGFYTLCFRLILAFVDMPVFVSQENYDYCRDIGLARGGVIIYNGLAAEDQNFLSKEEAKKTLSAKLSKDFSNKFLIGSVGRLAYQKNYEFLIKNAVEIQKSRPSSAIIIIGYGPEKEKYQKMIEENKLRDFVILAGDIPDAYRYMKAFDLFILPSRYEGLPITLIETLFAGIPTLATDVGGNKEVLGDAGLLYRLDDNQKFHESLSEIMSNEQMRNELSQKATARATIFSIEQTANKYAAIYGL